MIWLVVLNKKSTDVTVAIFFIRDDFINTQMGVKSSSTMDPRNPKTSKCALRILLIWALINYR